VAAAILEKETPFSKKQTKKATTTTLNK
jgi:hypothetical protein